MKKIIKVFIIVFILGGLFGSNVAFGQFFYMKNPLVGKKAPAFSLDTLKNEKVSLDKFRDNQNAIVFFWATWCPHCREQLEALNKNSKDIEAKEIKLVLVDYGEAAKVVEKYAQKNNVDLEIFLDKDASLSEAYGLVGVPTFFFLDKKGVVVDVTHSLPEDLTQLF